MLNWAEELIVPPAGLPNLGLIKKAQCKTLSLPVRTSSEVFFLRAARSNWRSLTPVGFCSICCLFVYLHFMDCLHVLLWTLRLSLRFVPANHRQLSLLFSAWKSLEKVVVADKGGRGVLDLPIFGWRNLWTAPKHSTQFKFLLDFFFKVVHIVTLAMIFGIFGRKGWRSEWNK